MKIQEKQSLRNRKLCCLSCTLTDLQLINEEFPHIQKVHCTLHVFNLIAKRLVFSHEDGFRKCLEMYRDPLISVESSSCQRLEDEKVGGCSSARVNQSLL
ncbi:hypothetical protein VP01_849g1 [Puccinia sorghi]|uniref:Uncharacterized protein n=1 Tax=Puccinia sorghi TaxID=27349 RepID=A0A0L6U9X0_9BASI|nr:hypothetical protein VP01_849g1 [Puccinia sorghi]